MPSLSSVETYAQKLNNGALKTSFEFVPSPGQHFIQYGRQFVLNLIKSKQKNHRLVPHWLTPGPQV